MLCRGEQNLLYTWMLQGMRYVGVGEMWQLLGAHLGSTVSPAERTRRDVSERLEESCRERM